MPQKFGDKEGNRNLFKYPSGLSERLSFVFFRKRE